jgi:polyisoprenyl-teichoic acid--peptidoglycan teichoic acid transferase
MADDQRQPESAHLTRQPADRRQARAIAIATLYSIAVLAIALFAGDRLHAWARARILNTSPLSTFANSDVLASGSLSRQAPSAVSSDTTDVSGDEGRLSENDAAAVRQNSAVPPINVLLLGTDGRPDEGDIPRTDTMILLTLDPQNQTAGMLSLPRDLWVPIPGLGYSSKINTAYQLGHSVGYPGSGQQLAKDTVSTFIGQPVQYYVRVNFDGFVQLIDLIGGVVVVVPETIHDTEYPTEDYGYQTFHLDAGVQHLDGEAALKYVRTRNLDDDYSRARRQQQVLRAVADKVLRANMLPALIPKLPRILYTMRSSIETDIPMALQLEFANYIRDTSLREVRQLVLDSRYGEETYAENGAWILLPDRTLVRSALAEFFAPPSSLNSMAGQAGTEWVRIEVLNGTGEPGVAARTRDLLQSQGWKVVSIGDADRNDYGKTIIINYGVPRDLVEKVGVDLDLRPNLSSLEGLDVTSPVDVRIVVGRDFLTEGQ